MFRAYELPARAAGRRRRQAPAHAAKHHHGIIDDYAYLARHMILRLAEDADDTRRGRWLSPLPPISAHDGLRHIHGGDKLD